MSTGPPLPSEGPAALGFHRRLETHVAVAVTLVVALALGAAWLVATRAIASGSLERASTELDAARSAFYQLENDRADFAAAQTALVTALPVFRSYMTDSRLANDLATMQAMTEDYRLQLKASFCIVTSRSGFWLGSAGWGLLAARPRRGWSGSPRPRPPATPNVTSPTWTAGCSSSCPNRRGLRRKRSAR